MQEPKIVNSNKYKPLPPEANEYALALLKISRVLRTTKIAKAFGLTKAGLLNLEKKETK